MFGIAYLTIRLFAIYLLINSLMGLVQLGFTWPVLTAQIGWWPATLPLLVAVFAVGAGVIIWFAAGPISRLAVPPGQEAVEAVDPPTSDWTRLVVVVFGLYLIVTAIPNIASLIVEGSQQSSNVEETSIMDMMMENRSMWSQLAYSGTRLLLGLVMVIGRTGAVQFISLLKTFGLGGKSPPDQPVQPSAGP